MTPEQLAQLKELCKAHTLPQIVEIMGLPYQVIRHQVRKHGLRTSVPWKRPLREMREIYLHSEKHGVAGASKTFKVTRHVVLNIRRQFQKRVERERGLSPERLQSLRGAAYKHAAAKVPPDLARDFVSWITIYALEGKSVGDVGPRFIDYLRQTHGQTKEQMNLSHAHTTLSDHTSVEEDTVAVGVEDPEPCRLASFLDACKLLQLERCVVYLMYKFGLDQEEIADALGVSPSRISQLHSAALERIRNERVE